MSEHQAPYPAWIYRQSAVLPYRVRNEQPEVLLISSRGGKRWVVPKGIVEPGMSAVASAIKEAGEEAGVEGVAGATPLGEYRYRKWGGSCGVQVFALRVDRESDHWPEADLRRRGWFDLADAVRRVQSKGLGRVIERLPAALDTGEALRPEALADSRPPRLIYLLRHAKSSWKDQQLADEERPLAPRGERACADMARYLALADAHPHLVLCSSAVRTRQTLERLLPTLGEHTPVHYHRDLYLADTQAMLKRVRGCDDTLGSVMLIGHNPGMHELAMRLVGGGDQAARDRLATKFPTGALAILVFRGRDWAAVDDQGCELHSHVWPRDIAADPGFG